MRYIYNFFGGTCRFFALLFTVAGIALAFKGHLTPSYVALVGAIQALVLAHSIKEDLTDK